VTGSAAPGFGPDGPSAIRSAATRRQFHVQVVAHTAQTATVKEWKAQVEAVGRATSDTAAAMRATANWWAEFWNRSWIFVDGEDGQAVTRAYVLQRWMTAAGGRGAYPIKFNGSIFTVDPEFSGGRRSTPTGAAGATATGGRIPGFPTSR